MIDNEIMEELLEIDYIIDLVVKLNEEEGSET